MDKESLAKRPCVSPLTFPGQANLAKHLEVTDLTKIGVPYVKLIKNHLINTIEK